MKALIASNSMTTMDIYDVRLIDAASNDYSATYAGRVISALPNVRFEAALPLLYGARADGVMCSSGAPVWLVSDDQAASLASICANLTPTPEQAEAAEAERLAGLRSLDERDEAMRSYGFDDTSKTY